MEDGTVVYPTYFKPTNILSIERFQVMVSYNDIMLMKGVGDFQINEFKNVRREP